MQNVKKQINADLLEEVALKLQQRKTVAQIAEELGWNLFPGILMAAIILLGPSLIEMAYGMKLMKNAAKKLGWEGVIRKFVMDELAPGDHRVDLNALEKLDFQIEEYMNSLNGCVSSSWTISLSKSRDLLSQWCTEDDGVLSELFKINGRYNNHGGSANQS